MKKLILTLACLSVIPSFLQAQPAQTQGDATSTNASPANVTYSVVSRDANSRVWAKISLQTNADGMVVTVTNGGYQELATGLSRMVSNRWVDASATIVITNDGAQTTNARHYVHFMGNANTAGGAVHLVTPDQLDFYSRVYGLAYADSALDTNILVAPLQDSQGVVVGDHTVIYSNVFSGPITADLEFENQLGGLEQNVILRTQLPTPASLGLNNASTAVQIWTEFFDPPMPQQLTVTNNGNTDTAILDWGAMAMGVGKAFSLQAQGQDSAPDLGRVKKHWVQLNGRTFLVEEVPWAVVARGTQNLPLHASASPPGAGVKNLASVASPFLVGSPRRGDRGRLGEPSRPSIEHALSKADLRPPASLRPIPPKNAVSTLPSGPMLAAKEGPTEPGLVLDYTIMGSTGSNYVFQCDTTYYVSGGVALGGTNNIIEGGAVIKFANAGYIYVYNVHTAALISQASPYRMAVLTSMNDNSVGDTISGSTGSPSTGTGSYLRLEVMSAPSTLAYLRFCYAGTALTQNVLGYVNVNAVWDSQFVQCTTAIAIGGGGCGCLNTYQALYNVLMANCVNGVVNTTWAYGDGLGVVGQNVTADQVTQFLSTWSGDSYYWSSSQLENCLLTSVPNMVLFLDNDANYDMPYSSTVWSLTAGSYYQTVGAGAYYLTNGSAYRNAGTTNINPTLLASLQLKTTYPPVVYSNTTISLATSFGITAYRETNAQPDIGYAYEPLDLVFGGTSIGSNVTFGPGVAVGWFNAASKGYGIFMSNTMIASFEGTATAPVWWVRANTVQEEMSTGIWPGAGTVGGLVGEDSQYSYNIALSPEAHLNFTRCSVLADGEQNSGQHFRDDFGYLIVRATNSEFYGGHLSGYIISCFFTNCFMDRLQGGQIAGWNSDQWMMRNCTWHGGSLGLDPYATAMPISIRDCTFDGTFTQALDYATNSGNADYDYNAFTNTSGEFPVGGWFDVIVTSGFNWQSSWFGNYYLPSTSALLNQGDVTADQLGLFHFTTQTNQAPQGFAQVDIGYHYVATDGYGNPLDTSGDSLPDYLADNNGDGVYEPGDNANWLNPFTIFDQGVSYGGYYPPNVRLGYWRFNNPANLTNEAGIVPPMLTSDLAFVSDWSGQAVSLTNLTSYLEYPVTTNGRNYFNPGTGTIRFWFQPNWGATSDYTSPNWVYFLGASGSTGAWYLFDAYMGNLVDFNAGTNGYGPNYGFDQSGENGLVIDFTSNLWYQVVFTYSPSNTALYCNGQLLGTGNFDQGFTTNESGTPVYEVLYDEGCGNVFYPAISALTGFYFGNQPSGGAPVMGQLDELETFNYPLTPQAVAAGFPYFGGNSTNTSDTNYVGRSDMLQNYVDGTWNTANPVVQCRLGYWRFDSPFLYSEEGAIPLAQSNVTLTSSWSGTAANFNGSGSELTYPDVNPSGWANINCRQGTLRFWFKPNVSAASGSLVYLGNSSASQQWTLTNSGSAIAFVTESNVSPNTLSATCSLSTTNWTQITLTYGPTNNYLYMNGVPVATNTGVAWPSTNNRALGMVIGNNTAHSAAINGQFEEMETFNYQLSASEISSNFNTIQSVDGDLDGVPDLLEDIVLSTNRPFLGTPVLITGTVEAEQFDQGGPGLAYSNVVVNPTLGYRKTGMFITSCSDLGGGYSLNETRSNEWVTYSINVLVPGAYTVETRVEGIGTNGAFRFSFATNGITYAYITNEAIPTTTWTNVAANVTLAAGTNIMKLYFVTNGQVSGVYGTNVGNFNYISLYPWWQAGLSFIPQTNTLFTNATGGAGYLIPGTNDIWSVATNNAIQIQNAVTGLTSGGRVQLPAGTFLVAQTNPVEANDARYNAAVSIILTNIEIKGAGVTNTTLIAYNRATTIFSFGANQFTPTACTNFTLRDMTLEAQPLRAVLNLTNTVLNPNQIDQSLYNINYMTGALLALYGLDNNSDILITNCGFLYANWAIEMGNILTNVMVRGCSFVAWGGLDTYGYPNTYYALGTTPYGNLATIFDRAISTNLVIMENSYNGNSQITSVNTNWTNGYRMAPDGFVWAQSGAVNNFIARNVISNYWLEAVQISAGPSSVVGNTYYSYISAPSACALCFGIYPGVNSAVASACFIGNSVHGGRNGVEDTTYQYNEWLPHTCNCSGNTFALYPAFVEPYGPYGPEDWPPVVASANAGSSLYVCGNTVTAGGYGVNYDHPNANTLILNNDFSGLTYRGIGTSCTGDSMPSAQIYGNKISEGVSFHIQVGINNGWGWFVGRNQYLNSSGGTAPAFFDPVSTPVHLSN